MDRYTHLEREVIRRAIELVHHRDRISLLHMDGKDTEADEQENMLWMSECSLHSAVSDLEEERARYA